MRIPKNKKIAVISTPPTFVGERLCPLGIIPIGVLKIVSMLKKHGNDTVFINMHSSVVEDRELVANVPATEWKLKRMGLGGSRTAMVSIEGKDKVFLEQELEGLPFSPDEIWITCSFSFDYDLVREYVELSRRIYPKAKISVGGDFARADSGVGRLCGADYVCDTRLPEADSCLPDFSCVDKWDYGLFQLQIGCVNKCSFCHISMDKPQFYDNDEIIRYMRDFYDVHKPRAFMNWDPNVSLNRPQLEDFLEKYIESGMEAGLTFGKGLQPNLVDQDLMRLMNRANVNSVTIPMESASYQAMKRLSKPYTIISSVKLLSMAKEAGLPMINCRCTSLLGYPDDDLRSFFRIYLAILSFGARPSPFPVYLFPGAPDYLKYKKVLGDKDISEFHGQLWPLLPDDRIDDYLRLYKFIELTDLKSIQKNIHLLSPYMREALAEETGKFRKFTERCLNAKEDNLEEFRRISEDLDSTHTRKSAAKKETGKNTAGKCKKLLCIIANPGNPRRSVSKAMGEYYINAYSKANPGAEISRIDLAKEGLPFITQEYVDFVYYRDKSVRQDDSTKKLLELAEKYCDMIRAADELLIVAPMYTLSIPAVLKAFFETVASYSYYLKDKSMFSPKKVLCLISRDGTYPKYGRSKEKNGPGYFNVQETILAAALDFLGLSSNPDFIDISNLYSRNMLPKTILRTKKRIEGYVSGDSGQAYNVF